MLQDRGVKAVTTREGGGVAPPSNPVMRERETVMALVTGDTTMDTRAVRETSCVGVTTAGSLEHIITRKMTAVRNRGPCPLNHQ